jgi:hypothetical protein
MRIPMNKSQEVLLVQLGRLLASRHIATTGTELHKVGSIRSGVCPGHSLTQRTQKAKLLLRVFCHGPKGVEKLSCAKTTRLRAGPQVPIESPRGLLEGQSSCSWGDDGLPCSLNQGRLSLQSCSGNTGCVPMRRRLQCVVDACTMIRSRTGRDKRYMYEG